MYSAISPMRAPARPSWPTTTTSAVGRAGQRSPRSAFSPDCRNDSPSAVTPMPEPSAACRPARLLAVQAVTQGWRTPSSASTIISR